MAIPIDVVPDTNPPKFRWRQVVDSIAGIRVVDHEGTLPPTVEVAVVGLIDMAKELMGDNAILRGQVQGMSDRIGAQSELLSKKAEKKVR